MISEKLVLGLDVPKKFGAASYSLMKVLKSGNHEVVLVKGFELKKKKDRQKFHKEIKRISKYFDAPFVNNDKSGRYTVRSAAFN